MRNILNIFIALAGLGVVLFVAGYYYISRQEEGSYFDSDGVRIHYFDEGVGTPVVLVHGFAANSDLNWRRPGMYQRLLNEGFRVITMDLRGHGKSGKPHNASEYGEKMVKDVVNLVDYVGLEKVHLVGYSLGGFVALKAAVLYPDRWTTVTAMASGWDNPDNSHSFDALQTAMADFEAGKAVGPLINYFDETGEMKTGFFHTQMFKILTTYVNDRRSLIAVMKSSRIFGITGQEITTIKIPVCSIIGTKDPFLNKARALSGAVRNHQLIIIEGANHITTMSSKKAKDGLVDFLRKNG